MSWDPDTMPHFCANGDGNPIVGESVTGTSDVAVDEDGFCWDVDLLCAECLEAS